MTIATDENEIANNGRATSGPNRLIKNDIAISAEPNPVLVCTNIATTNTKKIVISGGIRSTARLYTSIGI